MARTLQRPLSDLGRRLSCISPHTGVIAFGDINMEELSANDEAVAEQFDAQRNQRNGAPQ